MTKNPHAVALGRRGGARATDAQKEAARRNAKLGGRPRGPQHIPAPGKGAGLAGTALCGRWARFRTGDHELTRRLAHEAQQTGDASHYCADCLAKL